MKDIQKKSVYGSQLLTITPVIGSNETYFLDLSKLKEDWPLNYIRIGNSSNSYLDFYIQNKWVRVFANEVITIDDRHFDHVKIVTNSVAITEGDLIINVQKTGMNADEKARQDYVKENKPLNKLMNAVRFLR